MSVFVLLLLVAWFSFFHCHPEDYDELEEAYKFPPVSSGKFINSGTPSEISLSFDCAVRTYAYEYGMQIQPRHGSFVSLFDALQLQVCNISRPITDEKRIPPLFKSKTSSNCTFYVSTDEGSDSNSGIYPELPFKTIDKCLHATRVARVGSQHCTINLMEGVYYLSSTIMLVESDSYLTFQNYAGANAVISGGIPLEFSNEWQLYKYNKTEWKNFSNSNNVHLRVKSETSNDLIRYLGKFSNVDQCLSAILRNSEEHGPFYSYSWHGPSVDEFANQCFGVRDISWNPIRANDIHSGALSGLNIWSRHVSNYDAFGNYMYGLRINDERSIRARYPDSNPETGMQYSALSGWISTETTWKAPITVDNAVDIKQTADDWPDVEWPMVGPNGTTWTGEGDWGYFWIGNGGPCATENLGGVDPPYGYWCSHDAPRHVTQHECPSGVYLDSDALPNAPYSDISDAVVHAWRPAHWYTWMWTAGDYNSTSGELLFSAGGFQGGEGEPKGAEWYIENVFEELTMANEYFYNSSEKILYYYYNDTSETAPPSSTSFVVTYNNILFNVSGTQANPVQNITFQGLTFRDTRYTFMDAHGLPSGGDWALQRQGAIFLQGTKNTLITDNLFTRLDGIGIFVSGYNRETRIISNDFEWIGDSAMAGWGFTSGLEDTLPGGGPDGRDGNQPRFTFIENNLVHEIGIWEKQSSMWFQAQSCQTFIKNNIFFNGPRAAVNVNDGFGGDNHMFGNLLLNTCRESGDHGPWNSWDRVPYITKVAGNGSSIIPAFNHIYNNFIIGTYQTQEGIDTDDGSSYYDTHDNFFVYGTNGLKSDFGGHDNRHYNNVYAFATHFYGYCCYSGFQDWFLSNYFVSNNDKSYTSNCQLQQGSSQMQIRNNSIFIPSGNLNLCNMTFSAWQALGNDPGTTINSLPSDEEIITMAKLKLKNN